MVGLALAETNKCKQETTMLKKWENNNKNQL